MKLEQDTHVRLVVKAGSAAVTESVVGVVVMVIGAEKRTYEHVTKVCV